MKHMAKRSLAMLLALVTVLLVFPVMTSTATAAEAQAEQDTIETYEDIYVSDGLVIWLNGFDRDNIDLAKKSWASEVGSAVATLNGNWKNGTLNAANPSSGIRYDLAACDGNYNIDLGISYLPKGSYTLETVAESIGLTVDGLGETPYASTAQYGPSATAFYVGPLKMEGFPYQRDPESQWQQAENAKNQLACYYIAGTQGWNPTGGSLVGYANGIRTLVYQLTGAPATMTLEHALYGKNSSTYRVSADGFRTFDFDIPGNYAEKLSYIEVAGDQKFQVFRSFPAEVYSVRVYDRTISIAEAARNHFADLCGYYGADVTGLAGMNDAERQIVYNAFATVKFDATSKAALEAAIAAQKVEITETVYDKAYVQDGLVLLLSAIGEDTSIDLANKTWYGKLGTGYAKFMGALSTEKDYGWKMRDDKSVGYDLPSGLLDTDGRSMYLDLQTAMNNSQVSYTVEYVADYDSACDTTSATHAGAAVTEKFGFWGGWLHNTNALDMLYHNNGINDRWGDGNGHLAAPNGNFWTGPIGYKGEQINTVTYAVSQTDTTASRTFYANAKSYYTQTVPGIKDAQGTAMTKRHSNTTNFFMAHSTTCDLYGVRIYNRTLTSVEVAQNHFVDLAAFTGADISGLATASDVAKASIYNAAINWKIGTATKAEVEALIERLKSVEMDEYDELYVQDGLTLLATAWDPDTSSADVLGQMWYNKVGTVGIILQGGVYAEGTNETGWKQGKGISWEQNVVKSGTGNKSTGLYLDYSYFDTNFTVQLVNAWEGLTNNGAPYETPYYYQVYHFETTAPEGWRTTEQPASGDYLTVVEGDVTYYYPAFKDGSNTYYWGTVVQKDKNGTDTVTWHKATALNADGSVKTYYGVTSEGARYGTTINDSVAFGNIRNMMWLNHTTVYYRSKGFLDGTERKVQEGSDFYANRWYYRSIGYVASNATADQANYDYLGDDRSTLRTYGADDPFVLTLTQEAKESATGVGIYFDQKAFWLKDTPTGTAESRGNGEVATHVPSASGMYQVKGIAGDYYAVRVYNKVLSEAEKLQNYFVDVCAYNGLDVTGVKELIAADPDAAHAMFVSMADFSMRDPRVGAMQAVIDAAVEGIVATSAKMNAYDKLYVKEDLVALFTAYDAKDSGVDLAGGKWVDKISGKVITLVDNSSNTAWKMGGNNQGVGYAFRTVKQLDSDKTNVGMRLPTEVLTNGNLAVEYTFAINPALTADGSQDMVHRIDTGMKAQNSSSKKYTDPVYRYTAGGQWGLYNGSTTSNFSFVGLQMCMFHLSDNPQGNSMRVRFFYSSKAWENTASSIAGQSGDKRRLHDNAVFGVEAYNTNVMTMTINRAVTDRSAESLYSRADFSILIDRVTKQTVNNVEGSDFQRTFYTVDAIQNDDIAAATAADAFFGMPATVYAIRIYTDTLTAAEMQQNHAVDLMAYFGLDVDGFSAADEATKTAVYEALAAYTFEATAEEVAAMQAAINAATWGIPVAEGFQVSKDGKALRIWASVDSFENVYRLGMTITFKQNGEVIYTGSGETITAFLSVTAGDETITAEELGAEGLYAASVTGFAEGTYTVEITPYVVYRDSTTVTGETESADITFTFAE